MTQWGRVGRVGQNISPLQINRLEGASIWLYSIHPTLINNLVGAFNRTNANSVPGLRTKDGKPVCYSCFGVKVADYPSTFIPST